MHDTPTSSYATCPECYPVRLVEGSAPATGPMVVKAKGPSMAPKARTRTVPVTLPRRRLAGHLVDHHSMTRREARQKLPPGEAASRTGGSGSTPEKVARLTPAQRRRRLRRMWRALHPAWWKDRPAEAVAA